MAGQVGIAPGAKLDREVERARVARHLWRAESRAGARTVTGLSRVQLVVRRLLLRELGRYRRAGVFPQNPLFAEPTPFFVDASGTRCAVAHLLELGGEGALVQRIARERNHARVRELSDEPRLVAWLEAAGLSLEEAALIQPSYCGDHRGCICDSQGNSYLEATIKSLPTDGYVVAYVEATHGNVDASIAVGSEVRVPERLGRVGTELVLRGYRAQTLEDGTPVYDGVAFGENGYACDFGPSVSREQYLRAVLSDDCRGTLEDINQDFNPDCGPDCGCRAMGGGSPTTAGILAALLGAIVARRIRARRSRPAVRED